MFTKEALDALAGADAIENVQSAVNANDIPGAIAAPGHFQIHDLEKMLPTRRRARGTMTTSALTDFAAYALKHKEEGATVFIDQDRMTADAVLNLGAPKAPGHADNRAKLALKQTAAYKALLQHATGGALRQATAAEFMEDWQPHLQCFHEAQELPVPKAIAAVRKLTIEALKKLESSEQQLSASRSTFESISASSTETLPTHIYFKTVPFHGLPERVFVMRLGVRADEKNPGITLRIQTQEQHNEEMAAELASLVRDALQGEMPVLVGAYGVA